MRKRVREEERNKEEMTKDVMMRRPLTMKKRVMPRDQMSAAEGS